MGKVIVFVTMSLWDEVHRGRHHYANILCKNHTVIWINRNIEKAETQVKKGIEYIKNGLYVLHVGKSLIPKRIDEHININNYFRLNLLRSELKRLKIKKPDIIWCYDYKGISFINAYKKKAITIYFCNDWFGEWTSRYGKWAYPFYEKKTASLSNYVITISDKLFYRFKPFNRNTYIVYHGLWLPDITPVYKKNNSPEFIGYVGTLNETLDLEFIEKIVYETKYTVLLAGPVVEMSELKKIKLARLIENKNVDYLGDLTKEHADIVRSKIDILLLPYQKSVVRDYGFPIKFFEYIGTGKPIVATDFMEWPSEYIDKINIYNDFDCIEEYLFAVYRKWSETEFSSSIDLSKKSTWSCRIKLISEIIDVQL